MDEHIFLKEEDQHHGLIETLNNIYNPFQNQYYFDDTGRPSSWWIGPVGSLVERKLAMTFMLQQS